MATIGGNVMGFVIDAATDPAKRTGDAVLQDFIGESGLKVCVSARQIRRAGFRELSRLPSRSVYLLRFKQSDKFDRIIVNRYVRADMCHFGE